jgi:hypothetical protein
MGGNQILHSAALRLRVTGAGNLDMKVQGYNDIQEQELLPFALASMNSRQLTRVCNFAAQFTKVKISTDEINEVFYVSGMQIFAKPMYSDYPQSE